VWYGRRRKDQGWKDDLCERFQSRNELFDPNTRRLGAVDPSNAGQDRVGVYKDHGKGKPRRSRDLTARDLPVRTWYSKLLYCSPLAIATVELVTIHQSPDSR
jgi:hypothetical protein